MAKARREQMQGEALRRMGVLKMNDEIIRAFEKGILYASGDQGVAGPADKEVLGKVQRVEDAHGKDGYGILIYHLIQNDTAFGLMTTMLYVSSDTEDWDGDFSRLKDGSYLTYAHVASAVEEGIGSVVIAPSSHAGAIRIG